MMDSFGFSGYQREAAAEVANKIEQFRNKDALKEASEFLDKNDDDKAELLARKYKERDGKTLGQKYEDVEKKIDEFPVVAYLVVLPILYRLYLQVQKHNAECAIDDKKRKYESFFKQIVEKGKNDAAQIQEELQAYSKEKLRDLSKQIIEKQSALFNEKMGTMDLNQIDKVISNLQTQLSNGGEINMKAIATCLSEPAQTVQANGQIIPNTVLLKEDRQTYDCTGISTKDELIKKVCEKLREGGNVDIAKEQMGMLNIAIKDGEATTNSISVNGVNKNIKCKQNNKGGFTLGT